MLAEFYIWLTTSCPPYVRRMEYLYQAIALRARYHRRKGSWQPHLEKARAFITDAAGQCRVRGRVVVLGSGLLLDVPLTRLAALFDEVVLIDIVHLPEVRKQVRAYPNVRILQHDVTGVAERLYNNVLYNRRELPEGNAVIPEVDAGAGLVISLNLVSQLAAIPYDYVSKKMPGFEESTLDAWCDRIRAAHVAALAALPCAVCVIADYAYVRHDATGAIIDQGSTVGDICLPDGDAQWDWHIAPLGEEHRGFSKTLSVRAWNRLSS